MQISDPVSRMICECCPAEGGGLRSVEVVVALVLTSTLSLSGIAGSCNLAYPNPQPQPAWACATRVSLFPSVALIPNALRSKHCTLTLILVQTSWTLRTLQRGLTSGPGQTRCHCVCLLAALPGAGPSYCVRRLCI